MLCLIWGVQIKSNVILNAYFVFYTGSCTVPGTSSTWTYLCRSSWELFLSSSKTACCTPRRTASTASYTLWVTQTRLHTEAVDSHVTKQPVVRSNTTQSIFLVNYHALNSVSICLIPPWKLECRAVMVFFHYCVLSNYFWLFIEGLYLFTLLVETFFPEKRYFYWYIIIGWGETSDMKTRHTKTEWAAGFDSDLKCTLFNDDHRNPHSVCDHLGGAEAALWWYRVGDEQQGLFSSWKIFFARSSMSFFSLSCWDMNDNAAIWWVIKGPVLASIMVRYQSVWELMNNTSS